MSFIKNEECFVDYSFCANDGVSKTTVSNGCFLDFESNAAGGVCDVSETTVFVKSDGYETMIKMPMKKVCVEKHFWNRHRMFCF